MAGSTIVAAGDASAVLRASARPAVDSEYVRRLQSLMPAKRNFLQRLADRIMGRPAVRNEQVAYAALLHGRMQVSRLQRDQLVRGGANDLQGEPVISLKSFAAQLVQQDDAGKTLAAFAETVAKSVRQNPRQARHVLERHGAAIVEGEIFKVAKDLAGVDDAKARALARVAHTTMVANVALADEEGTGTSTSVRSEIDKAFGKFEAAGTITDKLTALRNIEHRIDLAVLLSPAAKQHYMARVELLRNHVVDPGQAHKELLALRDGVTTDTPKDKLDERLAAVRVLVAIITKDQAPSAKQRAELLEQAGKLDAFLSALSTRTEDLAALAPYANLHTQVGKLDAQAYVDTHERLRHIRSTASNMGGAAALKRLDEMVIDQDSFRWIQDVRDGDTGIVDMIFKGAEWHEDAWRLKAAVIAPGDERALKNLDVQHNLRIVASELDRVMQEETLRGKDGADLPRNVFSATRADPNLIGWFMRHAPGVVAERNLVIANWISLSCYDPATGTVDASKTKPLFDSLRLQGLDPAHIEPYIQQGFRNSAAVVKCREQVCKFARALDDAKLLKEMEQARSVRFRAEALTQHMLKEALGVDPAGMSSEDIDTRMRASLKSAVAFATKNTQADLDALTARRDALVTRIKNSADKLKALGGDPKLEDLFNTPGKVVESVALYRHALDALADQETVDNGKTPADQLAAAKGRDAHLAALKFFNIAKLRENTDVPFKSRERGPKRSIENLRKIKDELLLLLELAQVERNLEVARAKQGSSTVSDMFVKRAMRVAVLQEALSSGSDDFTPKDKAGAILKRMAGFGFQVGTANQHMSDILRTTTEDLMRNTHGLPALCTLYEAEEQIRDAGKRVAGKVEPESEPVSDVQKKRAENAGIIRSQLKELAPNTSFAIRYGTFGEVSVSLPVFLGISVSGETRAQRDNAVVISHEVADGKDRFTLKLVGGASVRQGVSVDAIADLLSVKGFVSRGSDQGYSFTFDDRDACMNLALALASGDAADPRLWTDAKIQTEQSANKGLGASIHAGLDLGALALEAQAQIQGSRELAVQTSGFGRTETHGRHFEATASASATLAGDLGAKDASAGVDRTVSRTVTTYLGMLAPDCELNVSAKLINGNVDNCLKYVLPPALAGQIASFKSQLEGVEDGTRIFVRCRLDKDVRRDANVLLGQAEKILLDATLITGDNAARRRQEAKDAARALVVQAYALTAKPEAYIPEGLGWTTQALVEVTSSRKAFDYFASSEALETRFVPFESPAGLLRSDIEV
ncbi:MAG: hypothetical protein V4609_14195 [Pseudomonadota bacterium]